MIDEIIKQLNPLINGELIYLSQYGSHLYGLNTENSDLDFRGVYIPNLDDIILHKDKDEINEELEVEVECYEEIDKVVNGFPLKGAVKAKKVKVDVKIFSLQKFIQLCSKADTNALDLLFSMDSKHVPYYIPEHKDTDKEFWSIMRRIHLNRDKLINTDRLESPITYAFKQATKYSIKGTRRQVMLDVMKIAIQLSQETKPKKCYVRDLIVYNPMQPLFDDTYVKIDRLDNKGTDDYYLYICGVQHQFNLELDKFIKRIEEKINKEYTSQRTIDAKDGNDWKALSHAIRVLLEIRELLDTGNIQFPLKDKEFLLDIKQGKVEREFIDNFFNQELSNILERVQKNELDWKYDEEFWNEFITQEVKGE